MTLYDFKQTGTKQQLFVSCLDLTQHGSIVFFWSGGPEEEMGPKAKEEIFWAPRRKMGDFECFSCSKC